MVHRPPDSRLLTNLIDNEREYVKHLGSLFPLSHAALASLSAYAAASPTPHPNHQSLVNTPAKTIAAVVDVLAGANDALQRYNQAVDTWRQQLVALKQLEDDLAAVLRDRDIFITRLIKASKSTYRSSRLIAPLTGLGSSSLSSLPSSSSATHGTGAGPAATNTKLAQAQAELQACEAHLVAKEQELDARRISIAREGLGIRCRALLDCGWVWSEMGRQGLKALQVLGTDMALKLAPKTSTLTPTITPHLSFNPTVHSSEHSSISPSQSASQTALLSAETLSDENLTSTVYHYTTAIEAASDTKFARATRREAEEDVAITLPPAHAIDDLTFPTGVRAHSPPTTSNNTSPAQAPASRRKQTKRARRPPSHHIIEVSDEDSEEPATTSKAKSNVNVSGSPLPDSLVPRAPFPTALPQSEAPDSSSDDAEPIGPFEVVENNPFEAIRRSMLSPSASALFESPAPGMLAIPGVPSARPSAPDVRGGGGGEISLNPLPLRAPTPIVASGSGLTRRERRTSILGSLRGLFKKPRERERVETVWNDDRSRSPSSPSVTGMPSQPRTGTRARPNGWVTRTDTRIKDRRGEDNPDEPTVEERSGNSVMLVTSSPPAVARSTSGTRLRKSRPGASGRVTHEHANSSNPPVAGVVPHRAGVSMDGWITDGQADVGAGANKGNGRGRGADTATGASVKVGRSRTHRGTTKRRKISVADLRGSDQGHTDGEVDDRGAAWEVSLQRASSKAKASVKPLEASISGPISKRETNVEKEEEVEVDRGLTRKVSASIFKGVLGPERKPTDLDTVGNQPRRATTTVASSRKLSSHGDRPSAQRRSASSSLAGTRATSPSRPPPQSQPPSWSPSPSPEIESQPKQNARRQLGNGHASAHVQKHKRTHAQSPSLMSIVVDVTRRREVEGTNKSTSLELDRNWEREREVVPNDGNGHARSSSSPTMSGNGNGNVGRGQASVIKMPLRSALRNASRTPSPSPVLIPSPGARVVPNGGMAGHDKEDQRKEGVQVVEVKGRVALRDSASISSYETGRESFYVEEPFPLPSPSPPPPHSPSPSPLPPLRCPVPAHQSHPAARTHVPRQFSFTFPPPPADPPPNEGEAMATTKITDADKQPQPRLSSNTNTSIGAQAQGPVRRKSVRVSLQPTFSPTPPASAVYDEDGERAPWTGSFAAHDDEVDRGRNQSKHKPRRSGSNSGTYDLEDVWVDSSEEDEEYSRARRLLSLIGRQDKGKGKAKA